MAPVQIEPAESYRPLALAVGHLVVSVWLSVAVGRSLYRSHRELGPAQDTRRRSARRSKNLPIFVGLAGLSLASAAYGTLQYATLSYKAWASEHENHVRTRTYKTQPEGIQLAHLAQWLTNSALYLDAAEILAEKARRFWWAQQIDLSLLSWTMLLSIEGRRRNIPHLWCYQLLAQLVSLPYAQNLFFLALLLTPSPLPAREAGSSVFHRVWNRVLPPKPARWIPHPMAHLFVLFLNLCAIAATPLFVNTSVFASVAAATRILSFAPLALPHLLPSSWGAVYSRPHETYESYAGLFRMLLVCSVVLHGKATIVGLAYNAPEANVHRHSIHLPFDVEKRSAWERTTSAFGRILGATSDHPVVRKIGWDVLLSGASLGFWAAVRVTDVLHVMTYTTSHEDDDEPDNGKVVTSGEDQSGGVKSVLRSALAIGSGAVQRRSGRAQPAKSDAEPVEEDDDEEEAEDDSPYKPSQSELAALAEGDVLPSAGEEGRESAALAWGLTALGGLGAGSAAVYGGECIAR